MSLKKREKVPITGNSQKLQFSDSKSEVGHWTVSCLLHAAVTLNVPHNEIKYHCVWFEPVRPHLNGGSWPKRREENKDMALTWIEWDTVN